MFTIIQSHRTERLVTYLLKDYQSKQQSVFEPFVVIVPSMVLGDWLDKTIASSAGISTLVTTKFWGQYQWTLMQSVLTRHNQWLTDQDANAATLNVPEVAVLSTTVMQWRLFGYLTYYQKDILADETHAVHPLLASLLTDDSDRSQQDVRLWQLAADLARVFNRYLTHRDDWLDRWSVNDALNVDAMIAEKDALTERFDQYASLTPEWLVGHYTELEAAQRYLWVKLFAGVHQHRVAIEKRFWQALTNNQASVREQLPKKLRIFTIQQLPQNELDFLQKLSQFMDITLLHYNPSKLFWADIVDKSWLQRQQIINPQSVFLRDYGHALLSRLGKQSRETFAMLAGLSGNEMYEELQIDWQDRFTDEDDYLLSDEDQLGSTSEQPSHDFASAFGETDSLLSRLQNDVLMLDESATQQATASRVSQELGKQLQMNFEEEVMVSEGYSEDLSATDPAPPWFSDDSLANKHYIKRREWSLTSQDNSLSIHACHSLQRQLEILRGMIGRWLNEPLTSDRSLPKRHLSDIVVLLPDVDRHHALINSVFVDGKGQDGLTLPAKVTGVVDTSIRQLWEAITGFYRLLGSDSARFEAPEVLDWLMLPPLYDSFGLTHEQMSRGCDLLIQAGFVRGFDERHLQGTLDHHDHDYRFSFAHALDRLALGLVMPQAEVSACLYPLDWPVDALPEMSLPLPNISLSDAPLIEALCRIYQGLAARRDDYKQTHQAEEWLSQIESQVIHTYFGAVDQSRSMRAIYQAMNGFKSSLRANRHYRQYAKGANNSEGSQTNIELEHQLNKVETLPLKLSFMLDSIEDELESQQVSAEPTGVITFGRFGALRNVPFGLVVMLNMNLSEFPNRDRDNRYDLMKAGLARRGDRFSEDDDNGAFLDALLCARSACWIFYNGQSLTDSHEHLPANPVSELLQFLQGEVQWQWQPLNHVDDPNEDILTDQIQRYLPRLVEQWLVTQHTALPFARELFETDVTTSRETNFDTEDEITALEVGYQDDDSSTVDPLTGHSKSRGSQQTSIRSQQNNDWRDLLDDAMKRTKLSQQENYPPAQVWQSVFDQLNQRRHSVDPLPLTSTVTLPSLSEYQLIAQLLGSKTGSDIEQSNDYPEQLLAALADVIGLDTQTEYHSQLKDCLFAIDQIDVQSLNYRVRHPAKYFLREQQVHIVQAEAGLSRQEPLALDALSRYQVHDALLTEMQADDEMDADATVLNGERDRLQLLLYQDIMPAGVARRTTLTHQKVQLKLQCEDFQAQLKRLNILGSLSSDDPRVNDSPLALPMSLLTPTQEAITEVNLADVLAAPTHSLHDFKTLLPAYIQLKGVIPQGTHSIWLNVLPNSARPDHLLHFWLRHLYWQVARQTTAAQVEADDGMSIWRYNKSGSQVKKFKDAVTFKLRPIAYAKALTQLVKWALFANIAGRVPMTLLPEYALNYIDLCQKAADREDDAGDYYPKRSDFATWLRPNYGVDTIYDSCSQHLIWQYILQDQDAFEALKKSLLTVSEPLYQPMFSGIEILTD